MTDGVIATDGSMPTFFLMTRCKSMHGFVTQWLPTRQMMAKRQLVAKRRMVLERQTDPIRLNMALEVGGPCLCLCKSSAGEGGARTAYFFPVHMFGA